MITTIIIIATCIVSIIAFSKHDVFAKLMFNAYAIKHRKEWERFLTNAFVHADWLHLAMNMFVLYSFGTAIEQAYYPDLFGKMASLYYLILYVLGIVVSSIHAYDKYKDVPSYNAVGASGAVSAVVFASILIEPRTKLMFMFLPIPIPAAIFGVLYLAYSYYMSKRGGDNIGHDAHFWGAVFGFAFTLVLHPPLFSEFLLKVRLIFE